MVVGGCVVCSVVVSGNRVGCGCLLRLSRSRLSRMRSRLNLAWQLSAPQILVRNDGNLFSVIGSLQTTHTVHIGPWGNGAL